jgi:hypothetical protein
VNTTDYENPDAAGDPAAGYRTLMDTDIRPFLTAATPAAMRAALDATAAGMCDRLRRDITAFAAYGLDRRPPWAACEIGNALRAGFQLVHAVTHSYLTVMGFEPAAAIMQPGYHPRRHHSRPARRRPRHPPGPGRPRHRHHE